MSSEVAAAVATELQWESLKLLGGFRKEELSFVMLVRVNTLTGTGDLEQKMMIGDYKDWSKIQQLSL